MIFWTYISGTIEVDVPGRTQAEKDYPYGTERGDQGYQRT